jgi:hypothetical protein
MIALNDCIAISGLNEKEVIAISQHGHMPETAAAAMDRYLLRHPGGASKILDMMRDRHPRRADARRSRSCLRAVDCVAALPRDKYRSGLHRPEAS